ncbi:MAG TPA: ribosome biogenesis GTP-binding protein YihA/YsxC [Anaeromyxobacteraceae bacterium]|nr:ribosome biogenesis GTP-binding protein YihA/YsxC [Anaeromyxobacteraceae bacterium]
MSVKVLSAEFLRTSTHRGQWPPEKLPEFAFVGRSNVGKSSMLNALTRRDKLARVSATPGRTQALQFFEVSVKPSPTVKAVRLRFCDLPGYGWAQVSKADRERWGEMIEEYIRDREQLLAVVLIVDARHPPQPSDRDALEFVTSLGRRAVVAATKMDKLTRNQRLSAGKQIERDLGLTAGEVVPFSAMEGTGTDALWSRLLAFARE